MAAHDVEVKWGPKGFEKEARIISGIDFPIDQAQ